MAGFYLDAWNDLSTERPVGMGEGYIPRSKIKQYGEEDLELSGDDLDFFISIIRKVDGDYVSDANSKPSDPAMTNSVAGGDAEGVKEIVTNLAADKTKPAHKKKPGRASR